MNKENNEDLLGRYDEMELVEVSGVEAYGGTGVGCATISVASAVATAASTAACPTTKCTSKC